MNKQVFSRLILFLLSLSLLGLAIFFSFQPARLKEEKTFFGLGTYIKITLYPAQKVNSSLVFNRSQKIIKSLENQTNFFSSSSELSKLNQEKNKNCSSELAFLINQSKLAARKTEGFFDPTIGPLTTLWAGFISGERGKPPSAREIKEARERVSYEKIKVEGRQVTLGKEQEIDLSGINKGFAVDKLSEYLKKLPLRGFVIDMTSSIMVWGEKPGQKSFLVALRNPRPTPQREYLALIPLFSGEYLSTSADNQQFRFYKVKRKGRVFLKRYHHLISPKDGYPASDFQSVTVITRSGAALTDALSTAIFVMKEREAVSFVQKNKLKAILVDKRGRVKVYHLSERKIKLF